MKTYFELQLLLIPSSTITTSISPAHHHHHLHRSPRPSCSPRPHHETHHRSIPLSIIYPWSFQPEFSSKRFKCTVYMKTPCRSLSFSEDGDRKSTCLYEIGHVQYGPLFYSQCQWKRVYIMQVRCYVFHNSNTDGVDISKCKKKKKIHGKIKG